MILLIVLLMPTCIYIGYTIGKRRASYTEYVNGFQHGAKVAEMFNEVKRRMI